MIYSKFSMKKLKNITKFTFSFRIIKVATLVALNLCVCSVYGADSILDIDSTKPKFINIGKNPIPQSKITGIINNESSSVVLLDRGLELGIDPGMKANVYRNGEKIGSIILVATDLDQSAGILIDLTKENYVKVGDGARINTTQNIF